MGATFLRGNCPRTYWKVVISICLSDYLYFFFVYSMTSVHFTNNQNMYRAIWG